MFDIGFAELLIIAVVALMVIGPERLPEAVRTGSAWLNRFRRGFNDIKQEVQQELHNDAVLRELRESGEKLRRESESLQRDFTSATTGLGTTSRNDNSDDDATDGQTDDSPLTAAEQSAGHRETPAPFMRTGPSADTPQSDPGGSAADDSTDDGEAEAHGGEERAREPGGRES